jgi:hypothetical protein
MLEQSKKFRCSGKMKSFGFCGKFLIEKNQKTLQKQEPYGKYYHE